LLIVAFAAAFSWRYETHPKYDKAMIVIAVLALVLAILAFLNRFEREVDNCPENPVETCE
jgi:hypothetical protein